MDPLKMEQTKTNTDSDPKKPLDYIQGITGSQKEQYKKTLKDMMISCYGAPDSILKNLSTASEVILEHKPKKAGEYELLKDNDISRCHLYIDLGSNADILFKHLLLDSQRDMDTLSEANIELVKLLVEMENKVNVKKSSSILFGLLDNCANRVGLGKAFDVLLGRKVNQQMPDHSGLYPMHLAILKMMFDDGCDEELSAVIESMVEHNVDINVKNKNKSTPLHYLACGRKEKFPLLVKKLLDKGANPSIKDAEGYLPIHFACGLEINGKPGFISEDRLKILSSLLKENSPVDEIGGHLHVSPLHCCLLATGEIKDAVQKLLSKKASPNINSYAYGYPIHLVCKPIDSVINQLKKFQSQLLARSNLRPDHNGNTFDFSNVIKQDANIDILKLLLKHDAKVNAKNPQQRTPLHLIACSKGKKKPAIEILLKNKAQVDVIDNLGAFPIHYLCGVNEDGEIEPLEEWDKHVLNWLLKHDGDINAQTIECKMTPLHIALTGNGKETNACVEQLLVHKANPDIPNKHGIYPIHIICGLRIRNEQVLLTGFNDNCLKSLEIFAKHKADLNIICRETFAPIHLIICGNTNVKKGLRVLLENGADPDLPNGQGKCPLHLVCRYQTVKGRAEQLAQGLIPVNQPTPETHHDSHIEDLVQMLIKHKADVNKREKDTEMTVLHTAIVTRSPPSVVKMLLVNKAEVDAVDSLGIPPIIYTFDLKHDPQDNQQRQNPETTQELQVAGGQFVRRQSYEVQCILNLQGPFPGQQLQIPLPNVLHHPNVGYVQTQIAQPVPDKLEKMSDQQKQYMTNVIQLLLDYEVNLNFTQTTSNYQEGTSHKLDLKKRGVLHFAVLQLNYDTDLVKKILEAGANPNLQDADGLSPLHYACKTSIHYPGTKPEDICNIVNALLEKGADPNLEDKRYNTPLHFAVECGIEKIVEQLLERGADWRKRNLKGLKPAELVEADSVANKIINEHIESVNAKKMNESRNQEKLSTPQDEETKKLFRIFRFVSVRLVAHGWKNFLRDLEPYDDMEETESFISDLDAKQDSLQEKVYCGLVQWKRSRGNKANIKALIQSMEDCDLIELAEKVQERFLSD